MHSNIDDREEKRLAFLNKIFPSISFSVDKVAGDASFRSYYRIKTFEQNYILMDAPPEKESCEPFILIDELMLKHDIKVPQLFHQDMTTGFILMEDFGDNLFSLSSVQDPNQAYQQALDLLLAMQKISTETLSVCFDQNFIHTEMKRFETWFLDQLLGLKLNTSEKNHLEKLYSLFEKISAEQPHVFVHRDYHSRNLLTCEDGSLGLIDFQDAIKGPITYDVASLLKDCYVQWSREQTLSWLQYYFERSPLCETTAFDTLVTWFDFIGLQRHIKVLGIFSRLALRDNKPMYLQDIPRILCYIEEILKLYPELSFFQPIFNAFNTQFKESRYA